MSKNLDLSRYADFCVHNCQLLKSHIYQLLMTSSSFSQFVILINELCF